MSRRPQIAVCGASESTEELDAQAAEVGRRIAASGAAVVCGGLGGVMAAAASGAAEAGGDVIGILPGEDPAAANPQVSHVVAAGTGAARNLAVVASADAVIAIGGAWGTLSEIAFARRLGRTVVALGSWSLAPPAGDPAGLIAVDAAEEAVAAALRAAAARLGHDGLPHYHRP